MQLTRSKLKLLNSYLFAAVLSGLFFSDASKAATHSNFVSRVPYTLSISGGVSLGSYEAGLNWALLRYLRLRRQQNEAGVPYVRVQPDLMSVSGASAGSINALISAISWCVDDKRLAGLAKTDAGLFTDDIDSNLFRLLWLHVGIEELLPEQSSKDVYKKSDGLFTRKAFDKAIEQVEKLLASNIFRQDCNIPIGMTVTKVNPYTMSVAGVEVNNQRFMIPVRLVYDQIANNGRINIISEHINRQDPYHGNVIFLQGRYQAKTAMHLVDRRDLISAVLTSSAFPIAFGRTQLAYCYAHGIDQKQYSDKCPPGYMADAGQFLDGGVFDNVPLGVTKALAEPSPNNAHQTDAWREAAMPFNYIYIDPDNRRFPAYLKFKHQTSDAGIDSDEKPKSFGLRTQLSFLGGAVSTGRNYELYNVLRSGEWASQSYQYVCQVAQLLKQTNETACQEIKPRTKTECLEAKQRTDRIGKETKLRRETLADCLLKDSILLADIYNGKTSGVSSDVIREKREGILRQVSRAAKSLGNDQLSLSVRNSIDDRLADRRILLSTRFSPITGAMLFNFGAFVDGPFREYDFYAGVYDSLVGIADFICERTENYSACLSAIVHDLYQRLDIASSAAGKLVFTLNARLEHGGDKRSKAEWAWVFNESISTESRRNKNLNIIFETLTIKTKDKAVLEDHEFTDFVKGIFKRGYDTSASSPFMRRVYRLRNRPVANWYYPLTSRISKRLMELERNEQSVLGSGYGMRESIGLAAYAVHSFISEEELTLLPRSAAPAYTWEVFLPYEFGVDARNGGPVLAWQPSINFNNTVALDFRITPVHHNRYAEREVLFTQIDAYLSYRRTGLISSMGFGPSYIYTWQAWPGYAQEVIGGSVYVGLLQDKLRISFGERSSGSARFAGDSTYLYVTLTDLPGFVYWLSQ